MFGVRPEESGILYQPKGQVGRVSSLVVLPGGLSLLPIAGSTVLGMESSVNGFPRWTGKNK